MEKTDAAQPRVVELGELEEFAADGIVSKTVMDTPFAKVVLMTMAAGQSLSEHTASDPAVVHVLSGSGVFRIDENDHECTAGTWFYLPARQRHAVRAGENMTFLLTLFRDAG